jgi:hypothetical protein
MGQKSPEITLQWDVLRACLTATAMCVGKTGKADEEERGKYTVLQNGNF